MKRLLFILSTIFFSFSLLGQGIEQHIIESSSIKNQGNTGTCWSFATSSFIESEIMRKKNQAIDLSEMWIVRNIYIEKAINYFFRQGKANFSQGALAHDMLNVADKYGLVPEKIYPGKSQKSKHDHEKMFNRLNSIVMNAVEDKIPFDTWMKEYTAVLDTFLGTPPTRFLYEGKYFNSLEFKEYLDYDKNDYVHLTSFTHHPFGEKFILEIPDNFSNGSFLNIPLDSLVNLANRALDAGVTIAWDGDVSEKGFDARKGMATYMKRMATNQHTRQMAFQNFETTDDHLMHVVGKIEDPENGGVRFVVKNSWGRIGPFDGYVLMDLPYFKMKTVSITVPRSLLE